MNITDVDDRIIQNAREQGMSLTDYTAKYTEAFIEDSKSLHIELPELMPRATDHIQEMVEVIKRLEAKGYTYRSDGSVYFRIARFPGYGKLSKKDFGGMQDGARVDTDEYEKDDARDFVLWKARKEGEDFWETEIGPGRPGWHIECSAMSMKYLGETFDIHCGGVDLVFPHHENEIAQSEGATGKPFVHYWVHAEFLWSTARRCRNRTATFSRCAIFWPGGMPPRRSAICCSRSLSRQLNFTADGLHQAQASIRRLEDFLQRMGELAGDAEPDPAFAAEVEGARRKFIEAMDDDLNTSAGLAVLFDFVRGSYQRIDQKGMGGGDARIAAAFVRELDGIFAVLSEPQDLVDGEILKKIEERQAARKSRNFAESDRIRDWLLSKGIQLEDTRDGVRWKRTRTN